MVFRVVSLSIGDIQQPTQVMLQMNKLPYHLEYDDQVFKISCFKPHFDQQKTLVIERQTCRVKQYDTVLQGLAHSKKLPISLIVGVIIIRGEPFFAVVTSSVPVGTIIRETVYQIKEVCFIAFRKTFSEKTFNYNQTVKDLDAIRDNIINDNFYFCYTHNLTLTLQKKFQGVKMESMFFWNESLLGDFKRYGISSCWTIPIVQGYVRGFKSQTEYFPYDYTLIGRRSKHQAGTRFTSRGANSQGHVANFVQTQQVYCFHRVVISWVTLRGSIPLFWGQTGFGAQVKLVQSNNQKTIVKKHMKMLQKNYSGQILVVDLLSNKGGGTVGEHELQNRFEEIYRQSCGENYINFDLNGEVSKGKNDVQSVIDNFIGKHLSRLCQDFFAQDYCDNNLLNMQSSFIRVNCLDCLDRTNVVGFKTSQKMIRVFEQFINQNADMEEKKVHFGQNFKERHRELWTNMGDRISMIYSGTTSVASYLTKGEKSKTFFSSLNNGLKSLNRMYNANVNDTHKQQCIDWLLRDSDDTKTFFFQDRVSTKLAESEFCEFQQINLTIISWNCAQVGPSQVDLGLLLELETSPDILIVCLQEVVELNTYNVLLGGAKGSQNKWRQSIQRLFHLHGKAMVFMAEKDLVGILTLMFVGEKHLDKISSIFWSEVKTGFKGNLGNKGSVVLSFKYDDSAVTVFNCHLQAGEGKPTQRLHSLQYIENNCFPSRLEHRQYQNTEFKFLVGDLNFRLDMSSDQVKQALYHIEKERKTDPLLNIGRCLEPLLSMDQLNNFKDKHQILSQYSEGPINFLPTYKYGKKSDEYDFKRVPSWCDRILYQSDPAKILLKQYSTKQTIHQSDHKAVYAVFDVLLRKQDQQKKKVLSEIFMKC